MTMRALVAGLLLAVLIASPVASARPVDGMVLVAETISTGYESGLAISRTPPRCYLTDDWNTRVWTGSLAPGESFSVHMDFCYRSNVVLPEGVVISGSNESILAWASGARAGLSLVITTELYTRVGVGNDPVQVCSLLTDRIKTDGWYSGPVTLTMTNTTNKLLRRLQLYLEVNLDSSLIRNRCP